MKTKLFFIISSFGIATGAISAFVYNVAFIPEPPLAVHANPYESGIYANGIIESLQAHGSNLTIYPEISGKVTHVFVYDGTPVHKDDPLISIDDSVQRAIVAKDEATMNAAFIQLESLKAEPRQETVDVAYAQLHYAQELWQTAQSQLDKLSQAYAINQESVSRSVLDTAIHDVATAQANVQVAQAQYTLIQAGAWEYAIRNQECLYQAAVKTYQADIALLEKYIIRAPHDGIILRMGATLGSYISSQGVYDTNTQGSIPVVIMSTHESELAVRCYVDELLIPKLPQPHALEAVMMVRGEKDSHIPLEFVRIQPYAIPNIALANSKIERVDIRVLPIIFKFTKPDSLSLYPGQLVDVFLKAKSSKEHSDEKNSP